MAAVLRVLRALPGRARRLACLDSVMATLGFLLAAARWRLGGRGAAAAPAPPARLPAWLAVRYLRTWGRGAFYPGQIIGYRRDGRPVRLAAGASGPALVQYAWGTATSGTTVTVTLGGTDSGGTSPGPTTEGNCLVVKAGTGGSSALSVSGITLGGSDDNFAKARAETESSVVKIDAEIWTDQSCAGEQTSVVVTFSGSVTDAAVYVEEWSGVAATSAVDKTNGGAGTSTSWSSGATGTLSQSAEVVTGAVFCFTEGGSPAITGPGSPWANLPAVSAGDYALGSGYQVTAATTSQTYSGTQTGFEVEVNAAVVVSLLGASGTPVSGADTGSGADTASVAEGASTSDAGSGADTGSVEAEVSDTDTGTGADTGTAGVPVSAADAGSAADMGSFSVLPVFPQYLLGLYVQILINGTWTDISSFVQQSQDIQITRARQDETQGITPAQCTMRLLNPDGRFSPGNPNGAYAPWLTRNVQLRVQIDTWSADGTQVTGYRFWGEIASYKPGWDQTGNYRYADITAAGPLRRYSQGNATIGSALRRYYVRLGGSKAPYAYWSCEDASGATEFASYVAGVPAMGFTGSPQLASDTSFGGSDGIPQVNSSSWHGQTAADSSPPGAGSITQTTPGTYEWTCPPGVTEVTGVSTAAGGGGGGAAGPDAGGGGGGGGGQSTAASIGVTAGTAYEYVVGEGGQAGPSIGAAGTAGGTSSWTGDTQACSATGGQGGGGGDTSTGGAGGAGTHDGGQGGTGQSSITTSGSFSFSGNTGGTGGADGGTAGQVSVSWPAPEGITEINAAVGGGAGGGAGGGQDSNGTGGGGGGGGGITEGVVGVVGGTTYTFLAGNGGSGGNSAQSGQTGGDSTITGGGSGGAFTSITAGGGGGGGAGTGGAGGAGSNDGTGGSGGAGGGGNGGYQGVSSGVTAPQAGGGGGGGIPASATTTAAPAANGGAGTVSFSWSGGAVSPVAADIVRFLLDVQSSGGTDGAILARAITYGTVERLDLIYHTADAGSLELIGYNSSGTQLFDSGTVLSGLNGTPVMVDIELTADGTDATWSLAVIEPGASSPLGTHTGTVDSVTVGYVSDWYASPDSDISFAAIGHPAVQTYADDLAVLAQVIAGYAGELAETRLARLCAEEGLSFTLAGPSGVTPAMQAQQDDTFPNVLQSCEDADRGLLFESRDSFGLTYRSRVSMQGQTPALTMDYAQDQVAFPLAPAADDLYSRNDIQLTRNNGSSSTAVQQAGPMSIQPPPNGIGDYAYPLTVYVYEDAQLAPMAAWMLTVGTVADERFPVISVNMARSEVASLLATAAAVDGGDYVQIVNPPSWLTSAPVQQLAWGMTETLNARKWTIDINAVPESPYSQGNPPTW